MEIKVEFNASVLCISPTGRLDTKTSPMLSESIEKNVTSEVQELVIDLAGLEYMSSAGIRVILAADRKMQGHGKFRLAHVSEEIREILDTTGVSDYLVIE